MGRADAYLCEEEGNDQITWDEIPRFTVSNLANQCLLSQTALAKRVKIDGREQEQKTWDFGFQGRWL
jgi:hypothetical protein